MNFLFTSGPKIFAECLESTREILQANEGRMWTEARRLAMTLPDGDVYTCPRIRKRVNELGEKWEIDDPFFLPAMAWMVEQCQQELAKIGNGNSGKKLRVLEEP